MDLSANSQKLILEAFHQVLRLSGKSRVRILTYNLLGLATSNSHALSLLGLPISIYLLYSIYIWQDSVGPSDSILEMSVH